MAALQKQVDAGRCPKQLVPLWADFFNNYKLAMLASAAPGSKEELAARVQATIADTVLMEARIGLGRGWRRMCGSKRLARGCGVPSPAPMPHRPTSLRAGHEAAGSTRWAWARVETGVWGTGWKTRLCRVWKWPWH